ncbi:hypothetical protein FLAT13_03551 [Flavobacterium salmonis]|uniref:Uncharacterized protein n=1 Tax=Flavobacterium salmonis TaxID=2654844 RepID=A0A6V6Z537_9FLAO|nr:hypothetical protein FLAT13_03551 [Flavobacterium salmonis]
MEINLLVNNFKNLALTSLFVNFNLFLSFRKGYFNIMPDSYIRIFKILADIYIEKVTKALIFKIKKSFNSS